MTMAIYVRSVQKQQQFYTSRGKWRVASNKDLDYVLKGFAPRELVQRLHPYLPDGFSEADTEIQSFIEGGVPRPVGAPLILMLQEFEEQVRSFYREHPCELDNIYDRVADENERLEFTVRELAAKALGMDESELTPPILFLVHRAVTRYPFVVDYDRTSVFTDHYLVQPKRVAKVIETVGNWVREHQDHLARVAMGKESNFKDHPLQKFINKAQRLIRHSRSVRSPTTMANVGPTAQRFPPDETKGGRVYREVPTEKFSDTDRMIIEYLQLYCIPPRRMKSGIMRYAGAHIMRSTGMYSTLTLYSGSVPLFLQELGVIAPWENLNVLDQTLALPGHGISSRSDRTMQHTWQMAVQMCDKPLEDVMKDLRTDWGDLPVYCVDDVDSKEIDDGISLEKVPGSSDTYWIRVHVANPSAFIPHDHTIAQYAAHRFQTLYVPERTYPMMPERVTGKYFSLAPGRPTLTISAKINTDGEVLETNIVNGYVRNVIYLTHDKLRELFATGPKIPPKRFVVGGEMPPQKAGRELRETLTEEDKKTFHTLRQIMLGFRNQQRKNGAFSWPDKIETPVSVYYGKSVPKHRLDVTQGRYFLGDPVISLQWRDYDPHLVPDLTKENLISTIMNFACWVTGRWCADRNIPVVYDGTWYHPEYPPLTSENISQYGGKNWLLYAPPKGISASSVLSHSALGFDAYVKSTSPLRRYTDMLAHYQVEAALRYERQHGRKFDAEQEPSFLPFPRDKVDSVIERSRWLRPRMMQCESASNQFWACQLLFRAFYFNECELPETFPCVVHQPLSHVTLAQSDHMEGYVAYNLPFGVRCQLFVPPSFGEVEMLDVVEAKIIAVDMAREVVFMEAVRLVKHFERIGDWA